MNFEKCLKLQLSGDFSGAIDCYQKLIKLKNIGKKDLFNSYCNLAIIYQNSELPEKSLFFFKKSLKINSKSEIVFYNIANIYAKHNNFSLAIKYYLKYLEINKKNKKIYFNLGLAFEKQGNIFRAIKYYKQALKFDDNYAAANCNLGNLYYIVGDLQKSENKLLKAIKINGNLDIAFNNLGLINAAFGNFKDAKKNFLKSIKLNSYNARSHYNLSSIIDYKDKINDNHLNELLKNEKNCQSNIDKMYYSFAIGKAYEDKKEYKKSFNKIKIGNKIRRDSFKYTIKEDIKFFKIIRQAYNKKVINHLSGLGFNSKIPIFIVGMPRSGTSLIEQILSSHPDVYGAGEINELENILLKFFCIQNNIKSLKKLDQINKNDFAIAGKEYVSNIKKKYHLNKYITNKLTLNFRWIGLIKIILPNAKIIHCKRNPIDTCLSIFQKIFPINGNEYSFDLIEIAKYYKIYKDLTVYWKKIIPRFFL